MRLIKTLMISLTLLVLLSNKTADKNNTQHFYKMLRELLNNKELDLTIISHKHSKHPIQKSIISLATDEKCNCVSLEGLDSSILYILSRKENVNTPRLYFSLEKWDFDSDSTANFVFNKFLKFKPDTCSMIKHDFRYFLHSNSIYTLESSPILQEHSINIANIMRKYATQLHYEEAIRYDSIRRTKIPK